MERSVRPDIALLPQQEDGLGTGAVLALGAHGLLLAALAFGVNWRASEPEAVSAELWAAVPQVAAPAPVEPPPPPPPPPQPVTARPRPAEPPPPPKPVERDADIALEKKAQREKQAREEEAREREQEQARREKAEREKAEREKKEKAEQARKLEQERLAKAKAEEAEQQKRQKAEEARLAKQREENLKRILGQAGATGGPAATGTAARDAGPSASYAGKIVAAIRPNIVSINEFEGNPEATVSLRVAADGTILSRRLIKSSGDKEWDEEVLRAIDRTTRLPRDENGRVPPDMELRMRPKSAS